MTYVMIDDTVYTLDTEAEIEEAQAALREAGLAQVPVFVGDPDGGEGDSYPNGQMLWA